MDREENKQNGTMPCHSFDASTGVGAQDLITDLLNMGDNMLGALVCGWVAVVLVQGGMVSILETKDCGLVTLLFFLVFSRCWCYYCPQAYWSLTGTTPPLTGTTRSLSVDYFSRPYIKILFFCYKLLCAFTSVGLSVWQLVTQDFRKKEVANKESRDFTLNVFYGLTLTEALVLLVALFSFAYSVGFADGSGDGGGNDPPKGPPPCRRNDTGNVLGGGSEENPVDRSGGSSVDKSGNGSDKLDEMERGGLETGDGSEYGTVSQSNDFNLEGPAGSLHNLRHRRNIPKSGYGDSSDVDEAAKRRKRGDGPVDGPVVEPPADPPAGDINDLKSERPADSHLQQRQTMVIHGMHPACPGKSRCRITNCIHNSSNTSKVSGLSVGVNRSELPEQSTKEE